MIKTKRSTLAPFLILPLLVLTALPSQAQVRISEFLAANASTGPDPDAWEFSDWIELHNEGDQTFDLAGYFLTDDLDEPTKWPIPGGLIEPGQRLLIWADGLDLPAEPLPPAAGENLDIFADAWAPAWEIDNRSRAVLEAGEADSVHQGAVSLAVDADLFTLDITPPAPVELTGYGSLMIAFHPGEAEVGRGQASFNIILQGARNRLVRLLGDNIQGPQIDLDQKQWQVLEISLGDFDLEQPLTAITFSSNLTGTFYLDSFRLVRRGLPVYHANFKLGQQGEEIGLFSPEGDLVDSVVYDLQIPDVSQGRQPGEDPWLFFAEPTPGAPNGQNGLAEPTLSEGAEFSLPGGFYQGAQTLALSHPHPDAVIGYTLDGSIPRPSSQSYLAPIPVDTTTVLRVRAFVPGQLPGPVQTRTYFIDEEFTLPVFSISTDPVNLWDDQMGIYVDGTNGIIADDSIEPKNSNQPWERPGHVEFYETDGTPAFSQQFGLSIHGAFSRHFSQKSLSLIARDKYGADEFRHRLFSDKPIDRFNSFILRNGGNDWRSTLLDDPFMQTLVEGRMDVDIQDYRSAILFLNGQYWGIHNIREKLNRYYPATNYGVDPNEVDIVEGDGLPKAGDAEHYRATIDYLETHDLGQDDAYQEASQRIDVIEYMNVQIALIYYGPFDNFFKNVKSWRPRTADGRWRWFLYDTDHGFGNARDNALEVATDPEAENRFGDISWGTLILRKLLENPGFRDDFIQRFAAHINYTFAPDRVSAIADSLQAGIESEMPRHIQRWRDDCADHALWGPFCGISSINRWRSDINRWRNFGEDRPARMHQHLSNFFDLADLAQLEVSVAEGGGGHILINDVTAAGSGQFFQQIPLRLKAEPQLGFHFAGWQGALTGEQADTTLVLSADTALQATFVPVQVAPLITGLRINELSADTDSLTADEFGENDDWIEIYNAGQTAVDIGGLYLTDRFDQPLLWQIPASQPDSTTIEPGQYLLLWADRDTEQGVLHADFRLSADGEELALVQLRGSEAAFLDSISFGPQEEGITFGRYPDGGDKLGKLIAPTPGERNQPVNTLVVEKTDLSALPAQLALRQNYPNPFNSRTTIPYDLPQSLPVRLEIFSSTGQRLEVLVSGQRPAGFHQVVWEGASDLASGVYFYRLKAGSSVHTRRLLLVK
ncbi:MAG: T9SS type A sorting domain-containing protein [Candidatus Latescibacteria bacterium]|nr:T9SS type A sorting domain-containing protein [Candidatus Latescibacterota bacterium]